ncbi:MAG TPA: caspase family protein [Hyphomicrobiaceae bacterium]|nr:caspase family protein [Hyphomicrobiaceae bacterium]
MLRLCALLLSVWTLAAGICQASAETRVALVVGNASYAHTTALTNPLNDAHDMTAALKAIGFDVVEATDADKSSLDSALRSFADKLSNADVALFFYAGHGLQVGAQNYLVPIDATLRNERDLQFEAVSLDFIMRQMEIDREGKTTIVILDACRDNPLARNLARSMGTRSAAVGRGLAAAATGLGTFIAYATQPGNVALDGKGRNSPFTTALKRHLKTKGRNLNATMIAVRNDVVAATDGRQVPWDHSALAHDFYFIPGDTPTRAGTVSAAPSASSDDLTALQARLRKLEEEAKTREAKIASSRLDELKRRAEALQEEDRRQTSRLFDLMRQQGQAKDHDERVRIGRELLDLRVDQSRRSQELARIRQEIEAAQPRADQIAAIDKNQPARIPPLTPTPDPNASAADFAQVEDVRLEGTEIRSFRAPNPDACRNTCATETGCVGYQHGRKIPVMGTCTLFSKVKARHEDKNWRSGMRGAPAPALATLVPPQLLGQKPTRTDRGFQVFESASLEGEQIKMAAADSTRSCMTVCRNTAGCTGATYLAKKGELGNMCTTYSRISGAKTGIIGASALIRQ